MNMVYIKYKGIQIWFSCTKRNSANRSVYINKDKKKIRFYYKAFGSKQEIKKAIDKAKQYIICHFDV